MQPGGIKIGPEQVTSTDHLAKKYRLVNGCKLSVSSWLHDLLSLCFWFYIITAIKMFFLLKEKKKGIALMSVVSNLQVYQLTYRLLI